MKPAKKTMKLYDAPRGVWLRPTGADLGGARVPPSALPVDHYVRFKLHHLDGMYSFCTDLYGNTVHPAAWTEVEVIKEPIDKDVHYSVVP